MRLKSITNAITLVLAVIGCIVAIVLTFEKVQPKADIGCSKLGGDCAKTVQSSYGHLGPVPTSIFGLGMYITLLGLCIRRNGFVKAIKSLPPPAKDDVPNNEPLTAAPASSSYFGDAPPPPAPSAVESPMAAPIRRRLRLFDGLVCGIALTAVVISYWLQYVSLYVINSFCPWCFTSACLVTIILFIACYDFLIEGRQLDGEQKMLAGVTSFVVVCFALVFVPGITARIKNLTKPPANGPVPMQMRDILVENYLDYIGDRKADRILVEFGDYQCSHCKLAVPLVEALVKSSPIPVKAAFRNYPFEHHTFANQAALAAEAAREQGKFWQMHDLIYDHQDEMDKPEFSVDRFYQWAEDLGLNVVKFRQDMSSDKLIGRVARDHVAAQQTKLQYTPTFYLVTPTQINMVSGNEEFKKRLLNPKDAIWK